MNKLVITLLIFMIGCTNPNDDNVTANNTIIATNLDTPWAIDFFPDGRRVFTERDGRISIIENNNTKLIGTIYVSEVAESGLHGIAVDGKHIYIHYTHPNGFNRVSRYNFNGNEISDEKVLIDNLGKIP